MKILIVEDELDTLEELRDYVEEYNCSIKIKTCSNPLLAIKACQEDSYDAALLDIQMPEMTGLELADCLSALLPEINIIFITAFNNYASEAFEISAVDYLLKPIRQERLNKSLDKIRATSAGIQKKNASALPDVTIRAFGKMVVSCGDTVLKWKRQKSSEIFAYLLHQHGAPVHKETLCEMMWPEYDPQKALVYLQTIMYQLRKNIAEIGSHNILIEYADHCYRLVMKNVQYDADLFSKAYEKAFSRNPPAYESLAEAEQLYVRPYLEEEGWIWALGRQQSLAEKYRKVVEAIINVHMESGDRESALFYIKKGASLNVYQNADQYFDWIKKNFGLEEVKKLEKIISEGE